MKVECQNRERNSLHGRHLIRQAVIEETQDKYDDQRSDRCDCNEKPDDLKLSGASQSRYR